MSGPRARVARMEPTTTSATGERGFTLIEILLVLALLGLLSWIFIGGSTALLANQSTSPDDQFWKACGAARKEALEEQRTCSSPTIRRLRASSSMTATAR
jgi:prepilin-type N-terminal cleavage/methylation domain-containing protein